MEATGRHIVAVEADVRDYDALRDAVSMSMACFGRLDVVIANAGVWSPCPTLEMSEATWSTTIDINLSGV